MTPNSPLDNRGWLLKLKFLMPERLWRALTRPAAALLSALPQRLTYGIGLVLRRRHLPYALIRPDDVVVQLGAPQDLLRAGRSRAAFFLRLVSATGKVVVMEPDPLNCEALAAHAARAGLDDRLILVPSGAWHEEAELSFFRSESHPASAALVDVSGASEEKRRRRGYTEIRVPVRSVDQVFAEHNLPAPRLVSITTNGGEPQILEGMAGMLADQRLTHLSIAGLRKSVEDDLAAQGWHRLATDDRGITFARSP